MTTSETHSASRVINGSKASIYAAFVDPAKLMQWLPPHGAMGTVEQFNATVAGRFRFILTFDRAIGKSSSTSDVVAGYFLKIDPDSAIVLAIEFVSDRDEFRGTMTMEWCFKSLEGGTLVSVVARNVPSGINRADHESGMMSSLDNLAAFIEGGQSSV